ncbi:MAG: nucleotidyltransferase family protein [Clostridia bacterium]|nr:nucleotidyltransferase family protein [Clostridia bacterium]
MEQRTKNILFALIRSAISGKKLTDEERSSFSRERLEELIKLSAKHDVDHLVAFGLKQNGLLEKEDAPIEKCVLKAVFRHQQLKYEVERLTAALEAKGIAFMPLKGTVLRGYYPQGWMRTSCDIDVLVHREQLDDAIAYLKSELKYTEGERATHDVSLFSPSGNHIELHFDLVEEGRANSAAEVLSSVWSDARLCEGSEYKYEMSDAFFYFYHIAHMAKHFECGGCGIRPFVDLWILDALDGVDIAARDGLLEKGGLLKFANAARELSGVWLGGREECELTERLGGFLLHGGAFGSSDNRVALQQKKRGGKFGYLMSRLFIPYSKLKLYYPVLEKHRWLTPVMQVRRWFMLLRPDVAKRAKGEIAANKNIKQSDAENMRALMDDIGL